MTMPWFRFYSEALDDAKVQRLPGDLFKAWVNLLCLASEQDERGTLPPVDDIAFRLRLDHQKAEDALLGLRRAGLLDVDPDTDLYVIHAWEKRQKKSDDVGQRVADWRARNKKHPPKEPVTLHVTPEKRTSNEGDRDREEERDIPSTVARGGRGGGRGADAPTPPNVRQLRAERETRIPDDFPITPQMRDWAREKVPRLDLEYAHEEFCTYWRSVKTKRLDWNQTWQNGMYKANARAPTGQHYRKTQADHNSAKESARTGRPAL